MGGGALSVPPSGELEPFAGLHWYGYCGKCDNSTDEAMTRIQRYLCMAALALSARVVYAIPAEGEPASLPADNVREFTGYAYEVKKGALLYTEHHRQEYEQGHLVRARVEYRDTQGTVFAYKSLDYRQDPLAPSFETKNLKTGEIQRGVHAREGYTLSYRENFKSQLTAKTLDLRQQRIADAGFDVFVRQAMPKLLEGKTLSFDFVVPTEQTSLTLNARLDRREWQQGREVAHIKVDFSNPLFRLLAQGLSLTYDIESHNLIEYQGPSNLGDAQGRYDVRIAFPEGQTGLQQARTSPVDDGELESATAQDTVAP